jgi:heme exporter protein B
VPAFVVFADVPLLARPGGLTAILAVANLGFAAVGTLLSVLTSSLTHRGSLLVLLLLPLISPVVLGAAQATRTLLTGGQWIGGLQFLAAFAAVFVSLGTLVFEYVMEE